MQPAVVAVPVVVATVGIGANRAMALEAGAESVLTPGHPTRDLPAEPGRWSTITQIYEGTNQVQRIVMARQVLKGW